MNKPQMRFPLSRLLLWATLTVGLYTSGAQAQYTCPGNEGAKYTTPSGITFRLICNEASKATQLDMHPNFPSQAACADLCSESPECMFCDYSPVDRRCFRFKEKYDKSKQIPGATYNPWVPVEDRRPVGQHPGPTAFDEPKCPNGGVIDEKANLAQFVSSNPICPTDNNKTYITKDGQYFKVRCAAQNKNPFTAAITTTKAYDFGECLQFCGVTPGCRSANLGFTTNDCDLYTTGEEDIIDCPSGNPGIHNVGYLIDPPTYPIPDEISIRCSTTCPGAHGQEFDGENGMQFRITCCKRHGVEAFEKEQMPTFQLCMQSCSLLGPVCSSVDYNERTGMCYYGKRSGEPTILAPGWASASAIGCKGYTCKEKGYCSATDQGGVTRDEL